jgi:O-methyltransferase
MGNMRQDPLDPLPYTADIPTLMSGIGRVDAHSIVAHYLMDNKMKGVYLDFGVGMVCSAVAAVRAYLRVNVVDQFHLFDSFCGLPKLAGVDSSSAQFKEGDYAYSAGDVRKFQGTVEQFAVTAQSDDLAISVIHLDMDLYESCLTVLNSVRRLLKTGVVFMFDDWNCFRASNEAGERKATMKWLRSNYDMRLDHWFSYGWHGRSFFCQVL